MYQRFLNNNDYIGIVTEEALGQLIRGNEERLAQAEEAAEASIVEYLTDNYAIERVLAVGKHLRAHDPQITYPAGVHFYFGEKKRIYRTLKPINGCKKPAIAPYWELYVDLVPNEKEIRPYSQILDYNPGDIVNYNNVYYLCLQYNGPSFRDIRIPGIDGWEEVAADEWAANIEYQQWAVKVWEGHFYTLITLEDIDWTVNPYESPNWGLIADYSEDYNEYELSGHDYVVYKSRVFRPIMNVNYDTPEENVNIISEDPRNSNIKKHLLRLAVYELHKLISPNNISQSRITDYETSILWLRDAGRLKINPQLPRRIDEIERPVTEYAIATFARDYDPNKNPWQI